MEGVKSKKEEGKRKKFGESKKEEGRGKKFGESKK